MQSATQLEASVAAVQTATLTTPAHQADDQQNDQRHGGEQGQAQQP
jgi:hypothetical protein